MSNLAEQNFHWVSEGEGERVFVFLHGFTLDHQMWKVQVDNFSLNARTICIDLPGHGHSPITTPPDIHEVVIKLRNLIKSIVGDRKIILCGLSLGGYLALEYARLFHTDLEALILSNTEARSDNEAEKEKRDRMIAKVNDGQSGDIVGQISELLLSKVTQSEQPDLKLKLRSKMDTCADETMIFGFRLMRNRPDYLNKLDQVETQTLVIAGSDDQLCALADVKATRAVFKNAELRVIPNTGHLTPLENPIEFNRAIHEFLLKIDKG